MMSAGIILLIHEVNEGKLDYINNRNMCRISRDHVICLYTLMLPYIYRVTSTSIDIYI